MERPGSRYDVRVEVCRGRVINGCAQKWVWKRTTSYFFLQLLSLCATTPPDLIFEDDKSSMCYGNAATAILAK